MKEDLVYKEHRIHTVQLPTTFWFVAIVDIRKRKQEIGIPGEYDSEEAAIRAAKEYIDQQPPR